ncbi:MAG TPA: glycosyltransferase family 4 protein, partial [Polyangiaceae bacterium]|nr:glycosyltransferase family 4 protein [Polyangiaceae bacterium]
MRERIAIVTSSYPREPGDASGHFVQSEARALVAAGHDVTVFAAGRPREEAGSPRVVWLADGGAAGFPGLKARLRAMPLRWFGLAAWLTRVRAALDARGPFERIVAHWLVPAALPLLALDAPSARLELVVHGSDARVLARLPRPLARSLLRTLLARDASLRCVSQELAELVQSLAGQPLADRLRVEPAPIDVSGAPSREQARKELGLRAEARLGVVVARLIAEKRVDVALRAALRVEGLDVAVIGDGPERPALSRAFPSVRFTGQLARHDALRWIAASDVVLSASRNEGAPS